MRINEARIFASRRAMVGRKRECVPSYVSASTKMKTHELTAKDAWKLLAIDVIDKPMEAKGWTGSFIGSRCHVYFSCGEVGCCENCWNAEDEFLSDHSDTLFRLIDTS
jgi:hypothetical protein